MKLTNIALSLALIGTMSLGMADDATTTTTTSVDAQIAAIQAAPAQERVQLMNQFKQRLMNMNETQRSEAIAQLQTAMQTAQDGATTATATAAQTRTQARTRTQTQAQEQQMQANEQMTQMQNMNQQRFGNQAVNMGANTPATVAPVTGGGATTPSMPIMSR